MKDLAHQIMLAIVRELLEHADEKEKRVIAGVASRLCLRDHDYYHAAKFREVQEGR